MHPAFQTLVNAAVLAPSGDNLQPWRFTVDEAARTITAAVDPTRDTTPMNRGQRMARIAVGCAVENIFRTAAHNGWELSSSTQSDADAVLVQWLAGDLSQAGEIPPVITKRCTNRQAYDGVDLSPEQIADVRAIDLPDEVRAKWVVERAELMTLAQTIGRADGTMFSQRHVRDAFLASVRFDVPAQAQVDHGLSLASLGISKFEQRSLPWLKGKPNWLVNLLGVPHSMKRHANRLIESAAGVVLILCERTDRASDFIVGRALESAWLELTALGYAVQPMMSLPVLKNLEIDTQTLLPPGEPDQPIRAVLRFGPTQANPARVGRLPA